MEMALIRLNRLSLIPDLLGAEPLQAGSVWEALRNNAQLAIQQSQRTSDVPPDSYWDSLSQEHQAQFDPACYEALEGDVLWEYLFPPRESEYLLNVESILEDAIEMLSPLLKSKKARLLRMFTPNLPQPFASGHALLQVFVNLILNALQALPEENGRLLITLEPQTSNAEGLQGVAFRVCDSGAGISLKDALKPFVTSSQQRIGLGLPVSQSLLQPMQGKLLLESNVFGGTSATVLLPTSASSFPPHHNTISTSVFAQPRLICLQRAA